MMSKVFASLAAGIVVVAVVGSSPLAGAGAGAAAGPPADTLDEIIDRVVEESHEQGSPPWAGVYSQSDGFVSRVLAVAPRAGFAYEWRGCTHDEEAYGTVLPRGEGLDLAAGDGSDADYPEHVDIVRWGKWIYLIPDGDRIAFCNAVNAGDEPGHFPLGVFLRRRGGGDTEGAPSIPSDWGPCLLDAEIEVEIVSWLDENTVEQPYSDMVVTTVVVSAGRNAGLYEGLELFTEQDDVREGVVVKVGDTFARVQFEQPIGSWSDHPDQRPSVGWILRSRRPPLSPLTEDELPTSAGEGAS